MEAAIYEYQAVIIRVVDGDTAWLRVDLGFNIHHDMSVRFMGINAPETSTTEGKLVREWLTNRLPVGTTVLLRTEKDRTEKYGRYLGTLYEPPAVDVSINQVLLNIGYAVPYLP